MSKYSLVLTIPFLPIGFNEALTKNKLAYNELKATWHQIIFLYSRGKTPPTPLTKVKLTLTRFAHRTMDYDGLVSSFKAPVDGLVHAKILKNDTWKITGKWEVDYVFLAKKIPPYIEIKVEEVSTKESENE